jgi:hypothetical protein
MKDTEGSSALLKESPDGVSYTLYGYRWVVLFFFSGVLFNFSLIGLSFSPIALDVAAAFEVDVIWVNVCSTAA